MYVYIYRWWDGDGPKVVTVLASSDQEAHGCFKDNVTWGTYLMADISRAKEVYGFSVKRDEAKLGLVVLPTPPLHEAQAAYREQVAQQGQTTTAYSPIGGGAVERYGAGDPNIDSAYFHGGPEHSPLLDSVLHTVGLDQEGHHREQREEIQQQTHMGPVDTLLGATDVEVVPAHGGGDHHFGGGDHHVYHDNDHSSGGHDDDWT